MFPCVWFLVHMCVLAILGALVVVEAEIGWWRMKVPAFSKNRKYRSKWMSRVCRHSQVRFHERMDAFTLTL